jgi:hypothetical protein
MKLLMQRFAALCSVSRLLWRTAEQVVSHGA